MWTLNVTAGSAGTMTILRLREDAVDPGNVAFSQNFTVSARVVATITFDDAQGESGGTTGVNIAFSEPVVGLLLSHLTASDGTLSNLTGSGTSWEADLAFPATGSGTVDVDLAIDSTTPQNDEATASIDYAEPADAVLDITLDATSVENGEIVNATFTFDITVGGFRRNDVSLTGAPGSARGPLVDNGDNTYSMEITAPATGSGTVTVTVQEDRVTPGNNTDSASFTYAPPTPTNTAPVFANTSYTFDDVGIAVNEVVGTVAATDADNDTLSYSLTGTDADKFDIDSDGEITAAEALDYGEAYSINVVANDGTDDTSVAVTINTETVSPRAPSFVVDSVTENSATITITAGDDGGESVTDWEYELDGDGTWVSFGNTDLQQTISNLDPDTAYAIKVRGVNSEGDGVASAAVTATTDAAVVDTPSNLTGASVLIANSAALGQSEIRPRGLDSDGTYLYALGLSQRRVIRITDLDTFASEYASASLTGTLNSLAFNDGSFYYADNNNVLFRIDSPFDATSTSTSLGNITNSGQIRSLCSDRTDLFGYDRSNSILYRITDNGADITATTFATVAFPTGTTGTINALFYFEDAFYLVNNDDNNLWKLPNDLASGSLGVTPVRVGSITDFDVSEGNPAGAGVLGSEAYFVGDDNNSLYRFTQTTPSFGTGTIDNQSWEVGTAITSLTLPEATGGTGDITYSLSPTLPAGVSFNASTRVLSGNPTGTFASTTFTYTATDEDSNTVELTFTIVVTAAVVALSFGAETIAAQAWIVGTAFTSLTLPEATGGTGTITYSLSPTLPGGATFTASTRVLSGNPTGRFSSATFTYTATDGNSDTVDLTFTIVVTAPAFSFASNIANQAWTVDTAVTVTLPTATGGVGTLAYSLSSGLPIGTTFTGSTRVLAGTPTGRFTSVSFTYTVTDDEGETATQTFTIVVTAPAIVFSPTSFANQSWTVGTAVDETLPAGSGGVGTLTASLTGTLPAGVTFTASTRALAGNPTAVFSSASFTYTMTDAEGETATLTFTVVVLAAALSFGSETISNKAWVIGTAVSVILPEATGGTGSITYSLSPTTLPGGVTFTTGTRALAGNPTAVFSSASFTYTATDANSATVELTFTIVVSVAVPLSIEVLDAQALTLNTDYDIEIEIVGQPEEVTAEGKWDGWYYDWDASTELLTISGNANTVLSDATWALTAKKGTQTVEEDVDYSVAPPAPVITEPQNLTITAGTDYEATPIAIAIANSPSVVRMEGLLVGLYFEVTGTVVEIKGMLPSDVDLTVTSGTLEIYASNGGGEDTVTPSFTIN